MTSFGVPNIGDIVYLASALIKVTPSPVTTFPDSPNQWTADLKVIGDPGGWDLSALAGPAGPAGRSLFGVRNAYDVDPTRPVVNTPADLPTDLTNLKSDIGLYWPIDTLDSYGHVIMTTAYVWYGTSFRWRQFMCGTFGAPGPVPDIQLSVVNIDPSQDSFVNTGGPTLEPSWQFNLAVPQGIAGPLGPLHNFPDVNEAAHPPSAGDLLGFAGNTTVVGNEALAVFQPMVLNNDVVGVYSMPQSAFTPFVGITQQHLIGTFTVPAQSVPWTPIVWGHLSAAGTLGAMRVGAQVLLNASFDATQFDGQGAWVGQMIARGRGNTLGEVNITPHYSSPQKTSANITPTNNMAVVAAGHPVALQVCLWNDGHLGFYSFYPTASPPALTTFFVNLSNAIKQPLVTIEGTVSALETWGGEITAEMQAELDNIANALGGIRAVPIVNAAITDVSQVLAAFTTELKNTATALGLTGVVNLINDVHTAIANLQALPLTITTAIQNAIDNIGNALGLPGFGNSPAAVATAINTLQPTLANLADIMGLTGVPKMISALSAFSGTVTADIQAALDGVSSALGQGVGRTVAQVHTFLSSFQTTLDNLANTVGLSGTGNDIGSIIAALAPWTVGSVSAPIQAALAALVGLFGSSGAPATINGALAVLTPLLGSTLSRHATDAQVFIEVLPVNSAPLAFISPA